MGLQKTAFLTAGVGLADPMETGVTIDLGALLEATANQSGPGKAVGMENAIGQQKVVIEAMAAVAERTTTAAGSDITTATATMIRATNGDISRLTTTSVCWWVIPCFHFVSST